MDGPAAPRKRPWELHAIVCLFLIAVATSYALGILRPADPDTEHLVCLAGMTCVLIGLFRGSPVAYWASAAAFAFLTVGMIYAMVEMVLKWGFVLHPTLLAGYTVMAFCSGTFGLLLSLRLRGALPLSAPPLLEDLPAAHAVAKVLAPFVFIVAACFSLATPILFAGRRDHGERNTVMGFKTIASAEADFRANDRDGNRVIDFWTGDVAGLYGIVPINGKTPIQLIELAFALADGHPVSGLYPPIDGAPAPRYGAWFAALRADRSVTPAETYGLKNPSRFGFIAYSEDYIGGLRYAFIINENGSMVKQRVERDLRASRKWPPGPPADPAFRDWPTDDELKARWSKFD